MIQQLTELKEKLGTFAMETRSSLLKRLGTIAVAASTAFNVNCSMGEDTSPPPSRSSSATEIEVSSSSALSSSSGAVLSSSSIQSSSSALPSSSSTLSSSGTAPSSSSIQSSSSAVLSSSSIQPSSSSATPSSSSVYTVGNLKQIPNSDVVQLACDPPPAAPISANCDCIGTVKSLTTTGDWPFPPEPLYYERIDGTLYQRQNAGNTGEKWIATAYGPGSGGFDLGADFNFDRPRLRIDSTKRTCEEYNLEHGK